MIDITAAARSLRAVPLPRLVDTVLDRLVVPGWSRLGYAARSAGWRTLPAMDGRTVIVTGASGGLGAAAARGLAGLGARVEMVVRDRGRGELTGPLRRTPAQGADTVVWLQAAAEPGHSTGLFWHDRAPRPTHRLRHGDETPQARAALWTLCVSNTAHR